jgi:hypothetical protein
MHRTAPHRSHAVSQAVDPYRLTVQTHRSDTDPQARIAAVFQTVPSQRFIVQARRPASPCPVRRSQSGRRPASVSHCRPWSQVRSGTVPQTPQVTAQDCRLRRRPCSAPLPHPFCFGAVPGVDSLCLNRTERGCARACEYAVHPLSVILGWGNPSSPVNG